MAAALVSTGVLLVALIVTVRRGLHYVARHPELLTTHGPRAYTLCQDTFRDLAARYHVLKTEQLDRISVAWHSPSGLYYLLTDEGIEERPEADDTRRAYRLTWEQIGGIGLRMQPGFRVVGTGRNRHRAAAASLGYAFWLLVVPLSGRTIEIHLATDDRAESVEFAAYVVALAEQKGKRVNAVGFDRPPVGQH